MKINKKIIIGLISLLLIGLVYGVQAGIIFTPEQFSSYDINNYDFEMTNEGWTITNDAFVLKVGAITAKKVYQNDGTWNGTIESIQVYKDYKYWKQRYINCRTGISPYMWENDTGEIDELGNPIIITIKETTKDGCQKQAKLNIKERIIYDREKERDKLQKWQDELNNMLNQYDNEWNTPPEILDSEI